MVPCTKPVAPCDVRTTLREAEVFLAFARRSEKASQCEAESVHAWQQWTQQRRLQGFQVRLVCSSLGLVTGPSGALLLIVSGCYFLG